MKKYYYLYKITNLLNNKIYIGVHRTNNLDDGYMGSGIYLKRAILKYGKENFEKEILQFFENEEEMWNTEAEIVNEDFVKEQTNYNIDCGGKGISLELCKKGREKTNLILKEKYGENWKFELARLGGKSGKGWKHTEESKSKISWLGKNHSEESKNKIGKANSKHQKGKGNSNYGKCWIYNEEIRQNRSIPKEELGKWIELGWQKGRKMRF